MSHGDQLDKAPEGFKVIGHTLTAPFSAIAHEEKHLFGIQFHPEVTHTPLGKEILKNFVINICECKTNWTMVSMLILCLSPKVFNIHYFILFVF